MFYVYIYRDLDNNPVYVGKGRKDRAWQHLKGSHNKLFWKFILQCQGAGYDIQPEIVFRSADETEALAREMLLISQFGRRDCGAGLLFNLTDGGVGAGGVRPSQDVINRTEQLRADPEFIASCLETLSKIKLGSPQVKTATQVARAEANSLLSEWRKHNPPPRRARGPLRKSQVQTKKAKRQRYRKWRDPINITEAV